jgi:hypothetical protein
MSKKEKKVYETKKAVMTEVQIKVDTEKRIKTVNEEIGKLCEKHEVQLVPILEGWPMNIHAIIKIVSTKKYEEAENKPA